MKLVIWFVLAWAALGPVSAPASWSKAERLSIGGIDHVRLEDWSRANHFQTKWGVPKQEFRLTGSAGTLLFTMDSAKVLLNGTYVWLSAPVSFRNGAVWIATTDLTTGIQPILFPIKASSVKQVKRIVIDPGHGGKDPGYQDGKQQEKKYTLLLAQEVSDLLNKAGFKATLTRSSDTFVDLPTRPDLARRRGADLFVSLHFNSAEGTGGTGVRGVEVYCMPPPFTSSTNTRGEGAGAGPYPGNRSDSKNILLGYQIQKTLVRNLLVEDRGVRRARLAVLRSAEMPAVLIEGGFMSNPTEGRKIYDASYRRQLAQAIVDGVKAYRSAVEQPANSDRASR